LGSASVVAEVPEWAAEVVVVGAVEAVAEVLEDVVASGSGAGKTMSSR